MRRGLILAACAALLAAPALAPSALAQSNPEGERLVNLGRQAFDMGNYSVAAQLLWDATMADEAVRDSAPLQTLRGRAVMRSGRPENAIRIFDLIGGTSEEYADALYWRGEALMMMTEPGEAADSFRQALVFDPNHQMAQARLSALPAGITAPEAVEAPLIEAAPTEIIGVERAAPARERTEADEEPIAAAPAAPVAPAAEAEPGPTPLRPAAPATTAPASPPPAAPDPPDAAPEDRAEADSELEQGRAAFANGEYADAAALLWRASQADPAVRADIAVQIIRGRAVMLSGRPSAAVNVFNAVAEDARGADLADALYWRGEAEMLQGREGAALESFRLALDASSAHAQAEARLAELSPESAPVDVAEVPEPEAVPAPIPEPAPEDEPAALSEADAEEAAAMFREQAADRRADGDREGEAFALSELYLTQQATPEEIERYAELMEGATSKDVGRDAQIAQLAGYVHHDLAIALYRSVERAGLIEGRNLAILRANLATAQLETGDAEGALETAELALETDEDYANAWAVRSLAKQELGDLGGALEDAKQAFDRGVTAPPVLALLNAAGLAVGVQSVQQTLVEAPELRPTTD